MELAYAQGKPLAEKPRVVALSYGVPVPVSPTSTYALGVPPDPVGAPVAGVMFELKVIRGSLLSHTLFATLNAHAVFVPIEIVYTVLFLAAAILAFCINPDKLVAADFNRML